MEPLKIQQKWEDMAAYAYVAMRHMPKSERWTLGNDIRACIWRGMALIVRANALRVKMPLLMELDVEIKILSALIRTAFAMEIMHPKQYERFAGMLVEIGKMLGGWMKAARG